MRGTWEKVYLEKGAYGSVRVDGKRMPFKTEVDERAKTLRLYELGGSPGAHAVNARYELDGRHVHIEGSYDDTPFTLELLRDLPN
jgi:hypothetical protein